jgi:hypothetical protein
MPPRTITRLRKKPGVSSGGIIQPIAMLEVAQTGEPAGGEVTRLLLAWSNGDRTALDSLTTVVYDELHRLASRYMKGERPSQTLQATALVNEAYMRLVV